MNLIKYNKRKIFIISALIILVATIVTIISVISINLHNKEIKSEDVNNKSDIKIDFNENKDKNEIINNKESKDDNTSTKSEENKDSKDKNDNFNSSKPNNKEDKPTTSNNDNTNKPSGESSNNNSNNTNNGVNPETEEKPDIKPEIPPVEKDKNNTKRNSMENTYGIKILYGDEIEGYKPKGISPIKLIDSNEIENYLNRLNIELAKYPAGFFKDFNKKGMPLTIYLIKSANGAFSGFTDYQFMNDIKLTLATNFNFEYTIHHELMHYIDCYLDIVMYPNNPYTEYESLNPSGFVYGNATSSQIYNMASNFKGAYFISSYAATHVKEDRAEVFQYMTARAYKPRGCFEPNEIIRKKAEIISKQIKAYFPSVNDVAHWDRFIVS